MSSPPRVPMASVWRTIRGFLWWTHPRGSLQYDVMVTLILAFIFLSPLWVDFKDKPAARLVHPIRVVVESDGAGGFIYQVEAAAVAGREDAQIRADLMRVIEPIAGGVELVRYEARHDAAGKPETYIVWVRRR